MEPKLPWYQSAIVRQQIVQIIAAGTALFGVNLGDFDVDATLVSIFAGIAGVVGVWTLLTRLFKPAPPMTDTAAAKELDRQVKLRQGGFFRPAFAAVLAVFAILAIAMLSACQVNPHKTAQTVEQHGDAVYGELTILKEQGARILQDATVSDQVKRPIAEAIVAAKPATDGLQDSLILYAKIRAEVSAGTSTPERLAVVDRELAGWIAQAQPIISKLAAAIAGAR